MGTYSYSGLFTECHLQTKQRSLQALRHFLKSFCNIQDTLHTSQWRFDREVCWSQSVLTLLPSSHHIPTGADSRGGSAELEPPLWHVCFSWRKPCTKLGRNLLAEAQEWFPYGAMDQWVTEDWILSLLLLKPDREQIVRGKNIAILYFYAEHTYRIGCAIKWDQIMLFSWL